MSNSDIRIRTDRQPDIKSATRKRRGPLPLILTVTAKDARQTAKIRGLGFSGVMATGSHHQMHHLAIARGEAMPHMPVSHPAGPLQKAK